MPRHLLHRRPPTRRRVGDLCGQQPGMLVPVHAGFRDGLQSLESAGVQVTHPLSRGIDPVIALHAGPPRRQLWPRAQTELYFQPGARTSWWRSRPVTSATRKLVGIDPTAWTYATAIDHLRTVEYGSLEQLLVTMCDLSRFPVKIGSQEEELAHLNVEAPEVDAQAVRKPVLGVVDHGSADIS